MFCFCYLYCILDVKVKYIEAFAKELFFEKYFESVLRIRILSDPYHFPGSGSVPVSVPVGVLDSGPVSFSNEHNKINWKGNFNKV
jgi:hypothetical protein